MGEIKMFEIGDLVVGLPSASKEYIHTREGYTGVVTNISEDVIELNTQFSVYAKHFKLLKHASEMCDDKVDEIDYDSLPQVGDLVRIMGIEEIKNKYRYKFINTCIKRSCLYPHINYYPVMYGDCDDIRFSQSGTNWTYACDLKWRDILAVVTNKNSYGRVILEPVNESKQTFRKSIDCPSNISDYAFCEEMLEVIEHGYIDTLDKEREEERAKHNKILLDDPIIKEMISKVDVKMVRKILSSSMKIDAKYITGVQDMLLEWANAKKNLYGLLGNNLKVTVEKELDMNNSEKIIKINEIQSRFPRRIEIHT